jgi:mono/diheme cytochrome c family protein
MQRLLKMTHCKQSLAMALLVIALAGCGSGGSDSDDPRTPGQMAYAGYCAGCHGRDGEGRPPAFPPLQGSEWLDLPPEGLTAIVLLGLRGEIEVAGQRYAGYMPPMQHIDDDRIAEVVRFIKARWSEPLEGWTGEDVARLRGRWAGRRPLEGRAGLETLLEESQ